MTTLKQKLTKSPKIRAAYYLLLRSIGFILKPLHTQNIEDYLQAYPVKKLQIGCGDNILKGWLNTDLKLASEVVFLDAGRPLPFQAATFDYLYCEHFIEHLSYAKGLQFLRECARILKTGGKIRIATPDIQFLIKLYGDSSEEAKKYIQWSAERFLPDVRGAADTHVINNFFRSWGHEFIYDLKTLKAVMEQAGFKNIQQMNVGESRDPVFQNIESHGKEIGEEFNRFESMVVEAGK